MARLSEDEQAQLDALTKKREAPEEQHGGGGRQDRVHYNIDFSDEAAVERAIKHGIITPAQAEREEEKLEKEEKEEKDGAPRRRVTGADRWAT